eukprot:TRINITY_DN69431_c0_g1_i1.p1 TRINITY_DN69431_c0_g1~~TRINITY_DN69431_c0_g1_i1.p1  ORF type:complete len:778 (-),score=178.88 TRINITY_DN69431_c0_g1_i1:44-2377(-)
MAKPPKKRGLIPRWAFLWAAPVFGVVIAPLYLHEVARGLGSEAASPDMLETVALPIVALVVISSGGCIMDHMWQCGKEFSLYVMVGELMLLVVFAVLSPAFWASVFAEQAAAAAGADRAVGRPMAVAARVESGFLAASAGAMGSSAGVQRLVESTLQPLLPEEQPPHNVAAAQAASSSAKATAADGRGDALQGWKSVGGGFCKDGSNGAEFNSLHASDKTLTACAADAATHEWAIAFDFAEQGGECDIRFPVKAYVIPQHAGYTWWGWGGGESSVAASGRGKKDNLPTQCFLRQNWQEPSLPTVAPKASAGSAALLLEAGQPLELDDSGSGRFSIVLACAAEGAYMVNTVNSFCSRTPAEVLQEIIVVDDGSEPPLEPLLAHVKPACRLRVLRHQDTMGLMIAKQTGGDAAKGEFIGFFDCHVAPNEGWHRELMSVLSAGPRRLAVPMITDLDLDSWDEKQQSTTNSKCYIDFNAQFMWFNDDSDFIPIISGGLVALTRSWWRESGGFDNKMRGWGGENIDQSLRTWLCGGEIVRASSSRIAHMWRVPQDSRTTAHYKHVAGVDNIARVAAGWFDSFAEKYKGGELSRSHLDVGNIKSVKEALGCKPFAYFLHRFRVVYKEGGLLPDTVFRFRSKKSGRCITRLNNFALTDCRHASWLHLANQDPKRGGKCCSGIRQWNAMECFDRLDQTGPLPYYCDITGHNANQQYYYGEDGLIRHQLDHTCLSESPDGQHLAPSTCHPDKATVWEQIDSFVPVETTTYNAEVQRLHLTDDMPSN